MTTFLHCHGLARMTRALHRRELDIFSGMRIQTAFLWLLISCLPAAAAAQTTPLTPSAPHEALTYFEGSWTTEESPPDQKFVETCSFMNAGRRHMLCKSTWQTASGPREGLSIFSFNAADSMYLYYGLRAGGAVEAMRGRPTGDGWLFTAERGEGAARLRERVTIGRTPAGFRLVAESAVGDGVWKVDATVNYRAIR